MKNSIKASLIIPTFNREEVLINTIKSVLKQKFTGYELIIVDQTLKHTNKTEEFLKRNGEKFRYFKVTPPSLPAARNFGLKKALGEIVIYIDDDVILDSGFIQAHFDSYKQKNIGSVVGRIREKNKLPSDTLTYFNITGFGVGNFNYSKERLAETAQGCNMSFRKKLLEDLGGFDTNYIGNAIREESDVSFRLRKIGFQTLFNPKASLEHLVYQDGGCREFTDTFENYIQFRNEILFFLRHKSKVYLPVFLTAYFYKYAINNDMIAKKKVLYRLRVILRGFLEGIFVYLFPKKNFQARKV